MEFACKVAGSKLVVVLGHTKCGAVKGACDHVEMGNLTELLSKLQPAVYSERDTTEPGSKGIPKNATFVENVSSINVRRSVKTSLKEVLSSNKWWRMAKSGWWCAMYDVETGMVEFYDDVEYIRDEQNPHSAWLN